MSLLQHSSTWRVIVRGKVQDEGVGSEAAEVDPFCFREAGRGTTRLELERFVFLESLAEGLMFRPSISNTECFRECCSDSTTE